MKDFVKSNLLTKGGTKVSPRKCREEWFENNGFSRELMEIQNITPWCNSIGESCVCVLNDILQEPKCPCGEKLNYISAVKLYGKTCKSCKGNGTRSDKVHISDDELIRLIETMTVDDIADRYGCSRQTIYRKLKDRNITPPTIKSLESVLEQLPAHLISRDKTYSEIAQLVGCSQRHVINTAQMLELYDGSRMAGSSIEREICKFLDSLGIEYIQGDRTIIGPRELDIVIPSHNLAIEVNGLYWHTETQGKSRNYHLDKTKDCEEQGYTLLQIWDNEWIDKREIWESVIKSKLGFSTTIGARKTNFVKISSSIARKFCDINHLQSGINSKYNFGLEYNGELVSVMTFGKNRFKHDELELYRFCTKLGVRVVGGFSKMLKNSGLCNVTSYANRRWSTGGVYKSSGFELIGETKPNFYYTKNGRLVGSRYKFQKHKLEKLLDNYVPEMGAHENMLNNGYERIYDCGNLKYIYRGN